MRPSVVRLLAFLLVTVPLATTETSRVAATPEPVRAPPAATAPIAFPNRQGSLKFAVLGDFGTGDRAQYELAVQLAALRQQLPLQLVILVGDNIYGGDSPRDYQRKFEMPYAALLDAGVTFYASLGNHDSRDQRFYEGFHMGGKLYHLVQGPRTERPLLRPRVHVPRTGADRVGGAGAQRRDGGLEDRVLPPPPLFLRRPARLGNPASRAPGTALRPEQRLGGVLGARSCL